MALRWESFGSVLLLLFAPAGAPPGTVAFDPPGPQIEVRVTRAGKTLPIAQVPNLQAGDRIWVHPNLPDEQSVRYVLVAAFLRDATMSLSDGTLILEDSQNVIAEFDPHSFGRSAFGPLRFRAVQGELKGDWKPLATLVRVPSLTVVRCPAGRHQGMHPHWLEPFSDRLGGVG